jgi:hypothetical protein
MSQRRRSAHAIGTFLFILCSLLIFTGLRAFAQDASTGAIRGMVLDPDGGLVAGATVAIVNAATGQQFAATTDINGHFAADLLPPGDYSARVEVQGFSPQVAPQAHLDIGGTLQWQFRLAVAGAKEAVTVSGAPPMVETQPSSVSTVIDEQAIVGLPLNGRRFTDLSLLAPGVTQDPRGLTSSSNGDLAFGGIRGFQSSYLVDGADNNNGFFGQARGRYRAPYQFSNETVQEFRVSSNTYGAELGRAGGAVVNVVTKSGSNHVHGSAFYFLRDSAFSATNPFVGFNPPDRQQQFGFTVGGPIRQNKIFFFLGTDEHVFHIPSVVFFDTGSPVLVPQKGQEPLHNGDYEDSDKALVFATAAQLNQQAGTFPSAMQGNASFAKVDATLSPRHHLSGRVNISRYWGTNNVFFDPSSPITTSMLSSNGEEDVATESASLSLTSAVSPKLISHLRAQFSRDLQQSYANSSQTYTRIYGVIDGIGRSNILPRQTTERRLHLADTLSFESGRHSWKVGGDALLTWTTNFFPSQFGGEYYFDNISVDPWTFEPMRYGMKITPLRAYSHQVPRYYMQNFGSANSNPNSNEYAAFLQDTMRVTHRLALSMGLRYDLQLLSTKGLVTNPLWPMAGHVPVNDHNFGPRVGLAYSVGDERPLVFRAGWGIFYPRIPQLYLSTITNQNGVTSGNLFLDNMNFYDRQIFPTFPNPLVTCGPSASLCAPPPGAVAHMTSDVSAFASNFQSPRVEQASLSVEREVANRMAVGASYMYVHGDHLIRARDVNLPPPTNVTYPVFDESGINQLGTYDLATFSTWQTARSLTCPWPPCINPLVRPIPRLGAINQFESVATSDYNAATISIHRRMTHGLYFRLAYTWARAIDNGQDAMVAGRPVTVQNSYSTASERGPSVTDQRNRAVFSWIAAPRPFGREHDFLGRLFDDWKLAGVFTYGSGRPLDARVSGDPNQDGNSMNDRLPGYRRNAFEGPDYATTDLRITRRLLLGARLKLDLTAESFNLFNRDNQRVNITDDGFQNMAGQFMQLNKTLGIKNFPAYFKRSSNFLKATNAYAPRQFQFSMRALF